MDYLRIYKNLILVAQTSNRQKSHNIYYERHHIMPKCLGGLNTSENLVLLTAKEHYIAHLLLCNIYPGHRGLVYAKWRMTSCSFNHMRYKVSARTYEKLKYELSIASIGHIVSENTRNKISNSLTGKTSSQETKKKMSDSKKGASCME